MEAIKYGKGYRKEETNKGIKSITVVIAADYLANLYAFLYLISTMSQATEVRGGDLPSVRICA